MYKSISVYTHIEPLMTTDRPVVLYNVSYGIAFVYPTLTLKRIPHEGINGWFMEYICITCYSS